MAAVAAGGLGLGAIKHHSLNSKPPSPFLGKKIKLKPSFLHGKNTIILRSKYHLIYAAGVELVDMFHDLFVGVGVGLPCTVMACGDMIYRSTLPKSNELTITVPDVILALGTLSYLWATPGVAPGFWDMFVLAFVERIFRPTYRKVEAMILGEVQDLPKGLERENRIIQTILRQILFALDSLPSTGIVHRDIKPQNIIFSEGSRTFKILLELRQICE